MSKSLAVLIYQGNLIRKLQLQNKNLEIENLRLRENLAKMFMENKELRKSNELLKTKIRRYEGK